MRRAFVLQLWRGPAPYVPHQHTCPACRQTYWCDSMWCHGMVEFRPHGASGWRRCPHAGLVPTPSSWVTFGTRGLPVDLELQKLFAMPIRRDPAPTMPPIWRDDGLELHWLDPLKPARDAKGGDDGWAAPSSPTDVLDYLAATIEAIKAGRQ